MHHILRAALNDKASDVHFTVGLPPVFRINGQLIPRQDMDVLQPEDTARLAREIMDEGRFQRLGEEGEIDFAYSLAGIGRFRVNAYKQRGSIAMAIRLINSVIPDIQSLGLPQVILELTNKPHGLVLVTGPTGSGKSTTLAAMIDYINRHRSCHIITLEDPVEYLHKHGKSIINQREVGSDTESFAKALRAAMRQDPDVILVGEMRDLDTIATAITAAETGHLVLATLHTSSAAQTIDRIIDVFPSYQQQQIRIQLAETVQGIVSQLLLQRTDGQGRVPAVEVMIATGAIRNLIREGKTHQILSAIQTGGKYGMQTMDAALRLLYQQGIISREDLVTHSQDFSALTYI